MNFDHTLSVADVKHLIIFTLFSCFPIARFSFYMLDSSNRDYIFRNVINNFIGKSIK